MDKFPLPCSLQDVIFIISYAMCILVHVREMPGGNIYLPNCFTYQTVNITVDEFDMQQIKSPGEQELA